MKKFSKLLFLFSLALPSIGFSHDVMAQQSAKPEQLIKWRQSAYQLIAWNIGRIKVNLDGQYNKEEVVKAANTIASVANSGLGALFAAGTETGKGWHDTAAKPALFAAGSKAGEYSAAFSKEANELAKLAANGDQASVKEQFGKLGRACKNCHDDYKAKE
jgi:cytochrome c556